jgi:hypothetical protein
MIRLALPDTATRDALDDLAVACGLLLVNIVPAGEAHPAQLIYVTPDRRTQIHLIEGVGYVLQGPGEVGWEKVLRARLGPAEAAP